MCGFVHRPWSGKMPRHLQKRPKKSFASPTKYEPLRSCRGRGRGIERAPPCHQTSSPRPVSRPTWPRIMQVLCSVLQTTKGLSQTGWSTVLLMDSVRSLSRLVRNRCERGGSFDSPTIHFLSCGSCCCHCSPSVDPSINRDEPSTFVDLIAQS